MSLSIISAEQRLAQHGGVKLALLGQFGIGKTALLPTLQERTLCIDLEAGLLAVQHWPGDSIAVRTWEDARDMACLIGGANPAYRPDQPYSAEHYQRVCATQDDHTRWQAYPCLFIDSITMASRLCLQWASSQPTVVASRTGKPDRRAAYGLLAQEMMAWIHQFHYLPDKDVVFVGLLAQRLDEQQRPYWAMQCEGSKTAEELPGIVDEVITLAAIKAQDDQAAQRCFVCHTLNPWGYPAKDRSNKLDVVEPPDLGQLLNKIKHSKSCQHTTQTSLTSTQPLIQTTTAEQTHD